MEVHILKLQDINEHEPKATNPRNTLNPNLTQSKLSPGQSQSGDLMTGCFGHQAGLEEFKTLQQSPQVDMGSIKSRDLGNMLSGELVRIGEAAAKAQNPGVDFGDLPSKTLTEMGKDVIKSE